MDTLRTATGPLAAADIATAVMLAKGAAMDDAAFKSIISERAPGVLRGLAKRGEVVRTGSNRNAQWAMTDRYIPSLACNAHKIRPTR